ncbi:MAG: hypothetical protein LBU11_02220 [Zoogloeaceae bacterium]|nr:hypothetical protein [Zoogloeaceae bacterium]
MMRQGEVDNVADDMLGMARLRSQGAATLPSADGVRAAGCRPCKAAALLSSDP